MITVPDSEKQFLDVEAPGRWESGHILVKGLHDHRSPLREQDFHK